MKKYYKREAYLLNKEVLIHGYKDKRGFHPDAGLKCESKIYDVRKKDKNNTIFYSLKKAKEKLGTIKITGGSGFAGIDNGMALTKVYFKIGDLLFPYDTKATVSSNNIEQDVEVVLRECLKKANIIANRMEVIYCLSSENKFFVLELPNTYKNVKQVTHTISL